MKNFLLTMSCALLLVSCSSYVKKETHSNIATDRVPASNMDSVKNWFSSVMGKHNMHGTNGENCSEITIIDQGEIMVQYPAQPARPNGADAQLSFFDDAAKMSIQGNTYVAQFTLGIEGGTDQHEAVTVNKNADGTLQGVSVQLWTGLVVRHVLLNMNCVSSSK